VAATLLGLGAHVLLFMSAFTGASAWLLSVLAGKTLVAGVGGFLAERTLRLPRRWQWILFAAYEIGPLLMTLWGLGNLVAGGKVGFSPLLWWLLALLDLVAGRMGIAMAKRSDGSLSDAG
jgi:hypothetical protein